MKPLFVLFALACACGGTVSAPKPVTLPQATSPRSPTLAERRAATCAKPDLAALGEPLVVRAEAAPSGVVRGIAVQDAAGHPLDVRAETLAPLVVGVPFDEARAREVERRLWQAGKWADVALDVEPAAAGVRLVFRVTPKPTVDHVFVSDGGSSEDAVALRLVPGAAYDPTALVSAQHAFAESLAAKGLLDARVELSSAFVDVSRTSVDVCLRERLGARVAIDSIGAHGSAYDAELDAILAREDTHDVPGAVVDRDSLDRDALLLAAALYDHGLLEEKIETKVERHGDKLTIDFAVVDGRVYRYGKVDVRGSLAAPKAAYLRLATLKRGAVFNRSEVTKVLDAVRALDTSQGRPDLEVDPETELDPKTRAVALVISVQSPPGFAVTDLKPGAGRMAKSGDTASVQYTGRLPDGTVFDTNVGKSPFDFKIGGGQVIAGFERGVLAMKVGGKRRVTIPPDLAYGKRGVPPKIPPGATLVFDIELLAIR